MAKDVSVVVPVFNAGPAIGQCVQSLLDQTLAPDRYEVILVDDGSSDGTGERLDELEQRHADRVRVSHIPNSGWPSRPRNVGVAMASGRYVQFVDNDDTLTPDALRRLVEVADDSTADVVIGKFASDFRSFKHSLFRQTLTGRTLADFPLEDSLTPHKLFSREFLLRHDLRFVEGIRNLEDQIFCMAAYVRAGSVAVVADTLCYHYQRRRGPGTNAGDRRLDPEAYYGCLERVFDVIDEHVTDEELRLRIYRRFYRNEMLGRLREHSMINYDPAYREALFARIRDVAERRLPEPLHARLPALLRTQSRLFLDRDTAGLVEYSRRLVDLALQARADSVAWVDGRLHVVLSGRLTLGEAELRLERSTGGWVLPEVIAPSVEPADRHVEPVTADDVEVELHSRRDGAAWPVEADCTLRITDDGVVEVSAEAHIDPHTVLAGQPLTEGLWDLRLRIGFGGMTRGASPALDPDGMSTPGVSAWATATSVIQTYATNPQGRLALDVGQWSHSVAELLAATPVTVTGGTVNLVTGRLQGPPDTVLACVVSFLPVTAGSHPVHVDTAVQLTPSGASLRVPIPRRVRRAEGGWQAWLRLGEPGTSAPVRLTTEPSTAAAEHPAAS